MAFPRWSSLTLRVPHGSKIEIRSDFYEKYRSVRPVVKVPKMYCLKHKNLIVGQRSFQICTRSSKAKTAPILMTLSKLLFVLTQTFRKRKVVYTSDADLFTYDLLCACTPISPYT